MLEFVIRRVLAGALVLFLLSTLLFFAMRAVPGDVVKLQLADAGATQEQQDRLTTELGLDRPAWRQYVSWLGGVVRGDLGNSLWSKEPVTTMLGRRLPVTIQLTVLSIAFAVISGLATGIISAVKRGSLIDGGLRVASVTGLSIPNFWFGLLLLTAMSLWFNWVPPLGYKDLWEDPVANLKQMWMPALALGLSVGAGLARMTRSSMLEVLHADYVRTIRAKGATERMVNYKHVLRNSLVPIITLVGLSFGALLGGTVILENMFSLPGIGGLIFDSVGNRDYPVIQAAAMLYGAIFIAVNIAVDLAYGWIDPRIRTR
ncbi:MAG: ABC transporter permease [Acidimicrobiales bacterium]